MTQVSDEIAIVGTLDFFTPIVDEPEAGATAYASREGHGRSQWVEPMVVDLKGPLVVGNG